MGFSAFSNNDQRATTNAIRPLDTTFINLVTGTTASIITTDPTDVITATANRRIGLTDILVTNAHATQGTWVVIKDGAGATLARGYAAAAGGGFSVSLASPILGGLGQKITATCEAAGAEVGVTCSGYLLNPPD